MASTQLLSSNAVNAMLNRELNRANDGASWIAPIVTQTNSNQDAEEYFWIGADPKVGEWRGERVPATQRVDGMTVKNVHYESSITALLKDLRRDNSGQLEMQLRGLATSAVRHRVELISNLILNGDSTPAYDGKNFFAKAANGHIDVGAEYSTPQANDIEVDVSAVPADVHGTATDPSPAEFAGAVNKARAQLQTFRNNVGQPINMDVMAYLVMVPPGLGAAAEDFRRRISLPTSETREQIGAFDVQVVVNPYLASLTDVIFVFTLNSTATPYGYQMETPVMIKSLTEGSDFEMRNAAWWIGIDYWGAAFQNAWQKGVRVKLV